jgi:capsular exopolysaccharide synthesis family protein
MRASKDLLPLPEPTWSPYARPEIETGTLVEYGRIVNRRRGTLILFILAGVLIAYLFTRIETRIYRAETLIEIESLNEDFLNLRKVSPTDPEANSPSPEYNIRTQIAVLESRPVLERALEKKGLEKRLLGTRKQGHLPWEQSASQESTASLHDEAVSLADEALRVRPQPNTRVVEIDVDSTDPQLAADLANSVSSAFSEVSWQNRWRSIQSTSEWLTKQLQEIKTKLEKSEQALQDYARAADLTFLTGMSGAENTTSEEHLKQLQVEVSKAEAERVQKQSTYEQGMKAPADSLPEVLDNQTLREYEVQLTALRRQLADLSSSFTPKHPKVISLRSQIAALEAARDKERADVLVRTKNEYEAALRREKLVEAQYSAVMGRMSKESDKMNRYWLLKRDADTTRQLYDSMVQRVQEANLASAMNATDVHVIESARAPETPYRPMAWLNMAFGLLSGLCLGVTVIVQRARSNTRIQEPGDSVVELNVPELGVIPAIARSKSPPIRGLLGGGTRTLQLEERNKAQTALTESFRLTLASILLTSNNEGRHRVIAFSSAGAKEGKTTVTSNIGIALAAANRRVLLIDGDLRRPRLHRIFEVDNNAGFYEALKGSSDLSIMETKVRNLFILTSGKGVDGEMLFYEARLRNLLDRLKTEFEMILIDTPPLLQVADARLICSQADATILVIAQHTPREVALLARRRLAEDATPLLGTILNKWDPNSSLHGYPSYSSYYSTYYAEERGR